MNTLFIISTIVMLFSSVMVITRKNAVHALLYLGVSFLSAALIFYLAGAPFIAILEIIIYAGAIMTLFVFVVMMLNMGTPLRRKEKNWMRLSGWLGPVILTIILLTEILIIFIRPPFSFHQLLFISPQDVGFTLITKYILAVELTGMLLMAGIIGAYHLGKREKKAIHRYLEQINK